MSPLLYRLRELRSGAGVREEDVLVGGDAAVCYEFAGGRVASYGCTCRGRETSIVRRARRERTVYIPEKMS